MRFSLQKISKILFLVVLFLNLGLVGVSQTKILFSCRQGESASNADWVIDADIRNLNSNWPTTTGGSESNAQTTPTPAQSGITSGTAENYWAGAISAWGVDLAKYCLTTFGNADYWHIESLPYNGSITYGDGANPQDLSNYKVVVFDEPNSLFTTSEKTALKDFVNAGGGLFLISDHDVADRNGDGQDAVDAINDLLTSASGFNNGVGITIDYNNISELPSTNINTNLPGTDPLLYGPAGNVTSFKYNNGASQTINPGNNASVKAVIFRNGYSVSGTTGVMMAYATYGSGRVVVAGDSSPADDNSGDPGDSLYDGWGYVDGSGVTSNAYLHMNATIWLFGPPGPALSASPSSVSGLDYVTGSGPSASQTFSISGTDLDGTQATVTAPTNFEVSTDNTTFSTSVNVSYTAPTLNSTTIYVRLKSGLAVNPYSGNAVLSDDGTASDVNIALSGNVTSAVTTTCEDFDTGLAASYTTGTQTLTTGDWYTVSVLAEAAADSRGGTGSAARINDNTLGASLRTPALNTVGTIEFYYRELNTGGGTFDVQTSPDNATWTTQTSQAFSGTTYTLFSYAIDDASNPVYVRIVNDNNNGHLLVDDFCWTAFTSATPTLTVSNSSFSGYTYVVGSGPSTSQTYNLSGSNLDASNITIGAPTNYEISLDNAAFGNSLTISTAHANYDGTTLTSTPIYIRLKAGLVVSAYNNELVTNSGGGVGTSVDVTNNGDVTAAPTPTLSASPSTLTGLDYVTGSGPSASQTFSISGTDLDGTQATVTAPTNFEVSTDNTTFSTSVNVSYTAPTLNSTTIYVRLKSGLAVNPYSGNAVLSDDGTASDVNIALSGNVTSAVTTTCEDFDTGLATSYTTGTQTLTTGDWYTVSVLAEAAADSRGGTGSAARINDDTGGASIRTPALNTVGTIEFYYRELNSGGGTFDVQTSPDNATWTTQTSQAFSGTTYTLFSYAIDDASNPVYVRIVNDSNPGHLLVDDFCWTDYSGSANPTVDLSVSTSAGTEAGVTVITVTATASAAVSGAQTVDLAVTGTNITAGDYTLSGTVITIPDAATTGTVTFTVVDDAIAEGTETATLTISNPSSGITLGTTTTQDITITDNEPSVQLSVSTGTGTEAATTSVTVTATASTAVTSDQTVTLTVSGTNITTGDYTLNAATQSTITITILGGNTTGTATFQVVDDALAEGTETATLTISNPSAGISLGATTTQDIVITDNEPTVELTVSTGTGTEAATTSVTVTATASTAVTGDQTVTLTVTGTNITTGDYTLNAATQSTVTITILNGATTGTVTFQVVDDVIAESTETAVLTISNPSAGIALGATVTQNVVITDNEITVALSVNSNSGTEAGASVITVTATASAAVSGAQTVDLAVTGTGITAGDYTLSGTVITIANGATTGSVTFTVVDDALSEGNETATLTISNPSSGILLGSPITQDILITDDDIPSCVSDLFISQVSSYETSASDVYVEIANYTGSAVDLTNYELVIYYNAILTPGTPIFDLTGTIPAGAVWLYADAGATANPPTIQQTFSSFNNPSGNDSWALRNNGTDVDVFGTIGDDVSPDNQSQHAIRNADAVVPTTTYNTSDWTFSAYGGGDDASFGVHSLTCPVVGATIVEAVAGGEAATIPALTTQLSGATAPQLNAVVNFDFKVTDDGGVGDANTDPTKISQIVISAGTGNDITDWTQAISAVELSDGTNTQTANITVAANTITISSIDITTLGFIDDEANKTYSLKIALKTSLGGSLPSTIDGLNFAFLVNRESFTTDATGSPFQSGTGTDVESGATNNEVTVSATDYNYSIIPVTVSINTDFIVEIEAVDINGNRELGYTSSVTLSKNAGAGVLSSVTGLTQAFTSGIYQWTDIQMDTQGIFNILASDGSLSKVSSDINAIQLIKFQGFDSAPRDNWTYAASYVDANSVTHVTSGGSVSSGDITTNSGLVIHPYNGSGDNTAANGNSWKMARGPEHLVMDNIDLSNYINVEFSFKFAGQDVNSGDELFLRVSYDGGLNWVKIEPFTNTTSYPEGGTFIADGNSGADWDFDDTNNPAIGAFYPENPFVLPIDDTKTQFIAEIYTGQYYFIDEVQLKGTFVPLTITTLNFMGATETTAIVNAELENFGGKTVTERGIVLSTSANPTTADTKVTDAGIGLGYYTANFSGLISNTTYYTRAYVIADGLIEYGNELNFTTCDGIGDCLNNTDLIISEYIESSCGGTNNAIEIFNGTGSTVNLKHYRLQHDNFGSYDTYNTVYDFLDFDLPNNQTFVITNTGSNAPEFALKVNGGQADVQNNVVSISGDEQIQLLKTTNNYLNYTVIEHVGYQDTGDSGSSTGWGMEKTFARNPDITDPRVQTAGEDATDLSCDPNTNGEWILYPDCYYDDLGSHRVAFDWEGDVDSDWFNIQNWNINRIPTRSCTSTISDVVTAGIGVFPVITDNATDRIAEAYKLKIANGANVTIGPDGNMSITGSIINSNGASGLVIKSDATGTGSLILAGLDGVTTEATVERYLVGDKSSFIFSPLTNVDGPTILTSNSELMFSYDETTADYWDEDGIYGNSGWISGVSNPMNLVKGYVIKPNSTSTYTFTGGNLEVVNKTFALTYTDNGTGVDAGPLDNDNSTWDEFDGWNIIGNPYTSAIDWNFTSSDWDKTKIENFVYYYDGTNYQCFGASPYDQGLTLSSTATGTATQYIPSGQAFFVKAISSGGNITIPKSARVHNPQSFWKKSCNANKINSLLPNMIRLNVAKNDFYDEMIIRTLPEESNVTEYHDGLYDAYKIFSLDTNKPQIYSQSYITDEKFAINSIPEFIGHKVIPLGLYIGETGEYAINMTENNFENIHVWLEDRNLSINTNLLNTVNYTFNQTAETNNDRFYLHFDLNHKPIVNYGIPYQITNVNEEYSYIVADNVFIDNDFEDVLTITASLVDGSELPTWLSFNPETLELYGIPNSVQEIIIKLTATDVFGAFVSQDFKLTVKSVISVGTISENSISIYPNPANDMITVELNENVKSKISILDLTGKQLYSTYVNAQKSVIDLSKFAKGVYFVEIKIKGQTVTKKIVIE